MAICKQNLVTNRVRREPRTTYIMIGPTHSCAITEPYQLQPLILQVLKIPSNSESYQTLIARNPSSFSKKRNSENRIDYNVDVRTLAIHR